MKTATIQVKLKPFQIPNFVSISLEPANRDADAVSLPIAELSHDALDALSEQWLTELYKKAGKRNPFVIRESERSACSA